jgi:uncharacterized membrane protein
MNLEHEKIVVAISDAEKNTSGEIQVVVTQKSTHDVYKSARKTFKKIGLGKTKCKNAVLFYIAEQSREFAILGDSGIHERVGQDFWNDLRDTMNENFRQSQFTQGLCTVIRLCGEKLACYFPAEKTDVNELENKVHVE